MKELMKPLFTWFVGLFNIGIYKFNVINDMDSLVNLLHRNGVEKEANELVHLYKLVTYQQETLVMLETFKCIFMMLSILFILIINSPRIIDFFLKIPKWIESIKSKFKSA